MTTHNNGMDTSVIHIALLALYFSTFLCQGILKPYQSPYRCLNIQDGPQWERRFDVNSRPEPIVIEVTHRPSHRLVSHILAILLQERLNYSRIEFAEVLWDSESATVERLSCKDEKCENLSSTTINMEVWMPPGFNVEEWVNKGKVIDCGPLGATARLGIFAHNTFIKEFTTMHQRGLDHWRTLENVNTRRLLRWPTWLDDKTSLNGTGNHLTRVQEHGCDHLMRNDCIPLLLDNNKTIVEMEQLSLHLYNSTTFTYYIANTHDLVKIVQQLDEMSTLERQIYFLNWHPNSLTVSEKFIRLSLPDCYDYLDGATSKGQIHFPGFNPACRFQLSQLNKVVSSHLRDHATHAFRLVRRLRFSQREYEDLLRRVPSVDSDSKNYEEILHNISCNWIRENRPTWENWTSGYNEKENLTISGLFALYGKWSNPTLVKVAQHAVDDLNNEVYKNSPYSLRLSIGNVTCEEEVVLQQYLSMIPTCQSQAQPIGIIAALCSDSIVPMVKLSNLQRRLVISPTAESATFLDKKKFKYFFRTVPSMNFYNNMLVSICKRWQWKQVIFMRKDNHFLKRNLFEENNIKVKEDFEMKESQLTRQVIDRDLNRAKAQNGRVFMVEYFLEGTCKILCRAFHLEMSLEKGFVWFVNPWFGEKWWELCTDYWTPKEGDTRNVTEMNANSSDLISCTKENMSLMAKGSFRVKHEQPQFQTENYRGYDQRNTFYYSYTYDAVRVLGMAVWELLSTKPSALSGLLLPTVSEELLNITKRINLTAHNVTPSDVPRAFHQVSAISFDGENSRTARSWVLEQLQITSSPATFNASNDSFLTTEELEIRTVFKWNLPSFSSYYKSPVASENTFIPEPEILEAPQWSMRSNTTIPVDGSLPAKEQEVCRVLGLTCNMFIFVINGIVLILFIVIATVIVLRCRCKVQQAKELSDRQPFVALCQELNDLDIPPTNIALNRPIGHGAFGVVYGGEAKPKGKERWEAIAVKVLSNNSAYGAKADFLSEAKLMRNLNHPNIVRLVGVCLKPSDDELYLIMEFMLNGDLKNRLLSRRAQALDPDNLEVRPAVLTKYSLDIARGLAYLHQQNIIHRDIACRNCLVGLNDVVKLGDFGMARVMTQTKTSSYYRLCTHIELPVRWLAPESTLNGFFNIQSDIWSYGIVLYEIITFGVFPYEELLDCQVVEMLSNKNFSIANYLPKSCGGSPVWDLILYCCQYDPSNRPDSMDCVIEFLESNRDCVRPYLTEQPPKPEKVTDCIRSGVPGQPGVWNLGRVNVNTARQRQSQFPLTPQISETREVDNSSSLVSWTTRYAEEAGELLANVDSARTYLTELTGSSGSGDNNMSFHSQCDLSLHAPIRANQCDESRRLLRRSSEDTKHVIKQEDVVDSPYRSLWHGSTDFLKGNCLVSTSQKPCTDNPAGQHTPLKSLLHIKPEEDDASISGKKATKDSGRKCAKFSTHVRVHGYANWSPPCCETQRLLTSPMNELA